MPLTGLRTLRQSHANVERNAAGLAERHSCLKPSGLTSSLMDRKTQDRHSMGSVFPPFRHRHLVTSQKRQARLAEALQLNQTLQRWSLVQDATLRLIRRTTRSLTPSEEFTGMANELDGTSPYEFMLRTRIHAARTTLQQEDHWLSGLQRRVGL